MTILTSHNPSTGEELWKGTAAGKQEVDTAIRKADSAFHEWGKLSADDRIPYLIKYSEVLSEKSSMLARALSEENGKPLWESQTEIQSMISKIAISIEAYRNRCSTHTRDIQGTMLVTRYRPHGVVVVLGPFNFPGHLPNGHIIPALLAGNTVVFKPSELTPRFGQLIADCWRVAGLPFEGIFTLIQGSAETGKLLIEHPLVRGVFFTGSEKVGIMLAKELAAHPEKILALEMGGNNPLVIGTIDDLQTAALLTVQSTYITSGQRCSCARRLIVPKGKKNDEFIEVLKTMIKNLRVGFYSDTPEPFMGPVISNQAAEKLLESQTKLEKIGGISLLKMEKVFSGKPLLTPGLMDVTSIKDLPDEEYFGPFLQLIRTENLEEAFSKAAETKYGLTAGLFSNDSGEFEKFQNFIKAGIINWNVPLTGASSYAPFGGVGHSGNHRPSAYFASDYCSYPIATQESATLRLPSHLPPGITKV